MESNNNKLEEDRVRGMIKLIRMRSKYENNSAIKFESGNGKRHLGHNVIALHLWLTTFRAPSLQTPITYPRRYNYARTCITVKFKYISEQYIFIRPRVTLARTHSPVALASTSNKGTFNAAAPRE
jgi:hypothetical protein